MGTVRAGQLNTTTTTPPAMPSKPKNPKYTYFRPVKRPTDYYKHYDELMDEQDKEMLKSMNSNLDILLTFAGLFSGVNSGFIALSLALFNPSPSDTTNALLRLLVTHADNSTLTSAELSPSPSPPPAGTTRVNCFFSASLVISLVVSLGSIIGKQWLIYYDRSSDVDPFQDWKTWRPLGNEHRGRVRYRKLNGLKEWRLRAILEAWLPMLLQLSVLIFFAGLIDFLHLIKPIVAWITLAIVALGVAAYVYTVQAAIRDPDCPFQTPVSTIFLPWVWNWNWRWSSVAKFLGRAVRGVGRLFEWVVRCLLKIFKWAMNRLAELLEPLCCSCLSLCSRKERTHDSAQPQDDSEDPHTVSPVDIQVTAWMLSTAMKSEVLRAAAGSLPLVHVPGELTSVYVDQSAISHLLFLFRDSAELLTEHELDQSSKDIPDAIIYSRAALHLFLSSFIQSRVMSFKHESIAWWGKYLEILGSAISRKPAGLLRMHERLVRLIKDGNQGRNIFNEPPRDPQSIPLYMAGLTTAWLSCAFVHRRRDLFQAGDFWKSIRGCLERALSPSKDDSNSITIPWNAINLAAWALSEVHEPDQAANNDPNLFSTDPSPLCRAWNAYTSDEHIGKHIVDALANYEKRTSVSDEYRRDVQEVYAVVMNALPSLAKEAGTGLNAELMGAQGHRISIARSILDACSRANTSQQATLSTTNPQPSNLDDDEAARLTVLDAALSLFIDDSVHVDFSSPDVRPFWKAITLTPSNPQLHRILLTFLQHCLQSTGTEARDAQFVFDECPDLKKAVIESTSDADARVQIAALRTLQYMVRYMYSKAEEETMISCLVDSGTRKGATFQFPEAQEAICAAVKRLVSRSTRSTTREILLPFCTRARTEPSETSAAETMLAVWQTCRSVSLAEDQQPEWMDESLVIAVAEHVEWRIGTYGLGGIIDNLRDYWDIALAKWPDSPAVIRLDAILSPTTNTAVDVPEEQRNSVVMTAGGLLTPDAQSGRGTLTRRVSVHLYVPDEVRD
ncbi:hypothetical protein FRB99_006402 [Tulasnella sp. 403]|nr:hypothetical protein FRB99_006402 [Tulasnella sp. 403]